MASVHFSVDHLCGYAQHFPLIPCGGDLLSFNYAQRDPRSVQCAGVLAFTNSSIANTKSKREFILTA